MIAPKMQELQNYLGLGSRPKSTYIGMHETCYYNKYIEWKQIEKL